jgi:hypothetical protein
MGGSHCSGGPLSPCWEHRPSAAGGTKSLGRRARGRRKTRQPGRGPYAKARPALFSLLKPYLRVLRGVSKGHLPGYVGLLQCLRNLRHQKACEQAELILRAALEPSIAHRAKKGEVVTGFDYFNLLQTARSGIIYANPTFRHEFFDVTRAQRVRHIPTDTHQNDLFGEMRPFETDRHRLAPS